MGRKLGVAFVMGGLAWSCVTPVAVDSEGTDSGGEGGASEATGGSGTGGAGGTGGSTSTGTGGTGGSTSAGSGGSVSTGGAAGTAGSGGASGGHASPGAESLCPFDGELAYDPAAAYPFCHGNESFDIGVVAPGSGVDPIQERCRENIPGSRDGLGRYSWSSADGSPDGEPVNYCLCIDACTVDADCAAGESGDALPSCIGGSCYLTCDGDEACPTGMTCTQKQDGEQRICMWGSRGAGCDTSEWPHVTN